MNSIVALASIICLFPPQDAHNTSLRGTIVDAQGKAVADARVSIATAAPRVGQGVFCPSCYKDCSKWTRSDSEGRFEIRELNPTLKFTLLASSPDKKAHLTKLLDPRAGEVKSPCNRIPPFIRAKGRSRPRWSMIKTNH